MITGKGDISGWLVRRSPWPLWLGLAAVLGAMAGHVARATPDGGMDNAIVVRAAHAWLAGGSPYDDPHFLYLPSAVLAAAPQALLPPIALRVLVPTAVTACLVGGWACALRMHGVPLRSRFAVLGLTGLSAAFAPFGHLILLGNWTVTAVLALPLALLLASRGRWVAAGAVLGAALALKPLLAPLALLFLFAGRWRALGVLVLVPAAASGACALLLPDPAAFFTRTLPFLLSGHDAFVRLYEASPVAVLPRLGMPPLPAQALALAGCAAGVACARLRWRSADPGPLRLAETAAGLMLSAFLVSRPSYDHYLLVVVPLLLAGLPYADSAARRPWFWLALVPQIPGLMWPYLELPRRRAFKDAFTLCTLAATVFSQPVRRLRTRPVQGRSGGSGAAAPKDDHVYTG
ncbi:glycosyltransferase 87 family protein [Streptomyces sp. NBC_01275]|uniref:glycosyltransferase 87 family protein n=1 Tax=Streptomyces sp. NBC_01275 TaxID=2903807 RepID=UPI002255C798|nr:glycosyltransferase 87 family protein [Streptomyces sp. NBC_01275]MCX4764376.1 glycosyltransferase 87 family protein [Streptomyces sp. NBC_01275]